MKFNEINRKYKEGEKPKIYLTLLEHTEMPFFITGFVSNTYEKGTIFNGGEIEVNRIDLYPFVGHNMQEKCDESDEGLILIGAPYGSRLPFRAIKIDEPYWNVADSFEAHKKSASKMMIKSACKKETETLKKYLQEAKELKVM